MTRSSGSSNGDDASPESLDDLRRELVLNVQTCMVLALGRELDADETQLVDALGRALVFIFENLATRQREMEERIALLEVRLGMVPS